MTEKTFKIVGEDISDGYHTFTELYDHRCLLWINYVLSDGCPGKAYWIPDHFEGWDLIGVVTRYGQISYHVPRIHRPTYEHQISRGDIPEFDGHTPQDVVIRLSMLLHDK